MTTPHLPTLLSVIHDEDLIRLRHRLGKLIRKAEKRNNPGEVPAAEVWINILDAEIKQREAEHKAKCKS